MGRSGQQRRTITSVTEALLPLVTMFVAFTACAIAFGASQELLVAVLLLAAAVAGATAARHGASWTDIQEATGRRLAEVLPAVLILLAIGALIASWMLSGTIPFLVYWGPAGTSGAAGSHRVPGDRSDVAVHRYVVGIRRYRRGRARQHGGRARSARNCDRRGSHIRRVRRR